MGRTALREETREMILDAASRLKEEVALSCVDRKNRRLHERLREIARSPGTPVGGCVRR
jgi:hypothetical protein